MNHPNGIQQAPTPTFAETLPMHMQTLTFPIRKASASLREFPQHPQCFRMPLRKPNYIIINSIERVSAIFQVGRSGDSVLRSLAPVLDQGATVIRCGMYSRISTRDKGQDLDNQRSQLLAFANSQGWQVVKEYADIESGAKADRPQFVAMMAAAAKREFDVLLFWALDRLSREGVWETHQYLARLDSYGVRFRSYSEPYLDSCGIFREAVISILATVAKQERLRLRERIKAGLERVGEKGTRSGKPVGRPRLVVRRDHIHQLRQDGLSWAEIARKTGLSVGTCRRACQQWKVNQQVEEPCQNLADKKEKL